MFDQLVDDLTATRGRTASQFAQRDLSPTELYRNTLAGYSSAAAAANQRTNQISKGWDRAIGEYRDNTNDIRGEYRSLLENQDEFGESYREKLKRQFNSSAADLSQMAAKRGLGNTTIALNMQRGANSDYAMAGLQLEDQIIGQKNQISGNMLQYLAGAQAGLGNLQTGQLGYQAGAQNAATQLNMARNQFTGGIAANSQQNANQRILARQQFGYQQSLQGTDLQARAAMQREALQNANWQQQMAAEAQRQLVQQQFMNQSQYAREFGYY